MIVTGGVDSSVMEMLIDAEKAFDRVALDFLKYVLRRVGFGPIFQQWIKLLYRNQTTRIIYAGHNG